MSDKQLLRLVRSFDQGFLARMTATPDEVADPASALGRAHALPEKARDLLDLALLASDNGDAVDPRLRPQIERVGEPLWLSGLLLPRAAPSPGATIDPRHYAGACRLHPGLRRRRPFREALPRPSQPLQPQFPPSDARWDAVVVAALLEGEPQPLNRDGTLRKDNRRRLLARLGDDELRWELALDWARLCGLARPAVGRLVGFPEARPRAVMEPLTVLAPEQLPAGRVLLALVDTAWVSLEELLELLRVHARTVLFSPDPQGAAYAERPGQRFDDTGWAQIEAPLFFAAADVLHRVGLVEATRDARGVQALRTPGEGLRLPPGFMLTPDLSILVGAGELPPEVYGRLCRIAPYQGGARVHQHRITQEGVAADLAQGHADTLDFLARGSRTGLPLSVRQSVEAWARSAERLTILTGVTLLEQDGQLRIADQVPTEARVIEYGRAEPPPARFVLEGDRLRVPLGEDALTVRAALGRVARLTHQDPRGWWYQLAPRPGPDPEGLLETLRRLHGQPELPGELEAAVLAAQSPLECAVEEAVLVHLPARVASALRRDRVAGPLLVRSITPEQSLVSRVDLPALSARLGALGLRLLE